MTEKNSNYKNVDVTSPGNSDLNNINEKIDFMNIDETDFESMSLGEKNAILKLKDILFFLRL